MATLCKHLLALTPRGVVMHIHKLIQAQSNSMLYKRSRRASIHCFMKALPAVSCVQPICVFSEMSMNASCVFLSCGTDFLTICGLAICYTSWSHLLRQKMTSVQPKCMQLSGDSCGSDSTENKVCIHTKQKPLCKDPLVTQVLHGTNLCGVLVAEICSFIDGFVRTPQTSITSDFPQVVAVSVPMTSASDIPHAVTLCSLHPGCDAVSIPACIMDDVMDACLALDGDRVALYMLYACIGAWLEGPAAADDAGTESLPTFLFYVNSMHARKSFLASVAVELASRSGGVVIIHPDEMYYAVESRHMDKAHCWLIDFPTAPDCHCERSLLQSIMSGEMVILPVKFRHSRLVPRFFSNGAFLCQQSHIIDSTQRAALARRCVVIAEHPDAVALSPDESFYNTLYQKTRCCWVQVRAWLLSHPHHPHVTLRTLCNSVPFFAQSASSFLADK